MEKIKQVLFSDVATLLPLYYHTTLIIIYHAGHWIHFFYVLS